MSSAHKKSIIKALRGKGFSKRAATNIAKATIRKSKQSKCVRAPKSV